MVAQTVFTKQTANKRTFMQVLLAKLKADNKFYAVKVLQKKVILKKKEVGSAVLVLNFLLVRFSAAVPIRFIDFLCRVHYELLINTNQTLL